MLTRLRQRRGTGRMRWSGALLRASGFTAPLFDIFRTWELGSRLTTLNLVLRVSSAQLQQHGESALGRVYIGHFDLSGGHAGL